MKKTWLKFAPPRCKGCRNGLYRCWSENGWGLAFSYYDKTITIFHLNLVVLLRK